MTESAIALFVLVALSLLGIAMEMEYRPSAPSYADLPRDSSYTRYTSSTATITYSIAVEGKVENRGNIQQLCDSSTAQNRLETEG